MTHYNHFNVFYDGVVWQEFSTDVFTQDTTVIFKENNFKKILYGDVDS